jgi:cell division protein FtsB
MPLIDRVLRGPFWVVMLGVLLAGIVFLNVSVLELNRGIAQTDLKSSSLERTNSSLRSKVAKLDSGERIQQLAAARGFVMPQPGDVTFLRPRDSDSKLAARRITEPAPDTSAATATSTATTATTTPAPTTSSTVAPATTTTTTPPPTTTSAPTSGVTPATTQVP